MVSRDPSSTLIAKPHSVERGAGLGRDLGQEQDSAWSGGRTQHREEAGLSMEWGLGRDLGWGQDSAWSRDWAETWAEGRTQHGQGTGLSVDRGQDSADLGRGQDSAWSGGRTQRGAVAGLKNLGPSTCPSGPQRSASATILPLTPPT